MNFKFASRPDVYEEVSGVRVMLEKTMEEKLVVWHTLSYVCAFGPSRIFVRCLCLDAVM
jgi:hypothetical protein